MELMCARIRARALISETFVVSVLTRWSVNELVTDYVVLFT